MNKTVQGSKIKPLKAVRLYCLYCTNNQPGEIKKCSSIDCPLYFYRFGRNESLNNKTALKAIKEYCIDCSDNNYSEVKKCPFNNCSLFPFRFGKNPNREGIGRKSGNHEGLKKYRICKNQLNSRHDLRK